MRVTVRRVLSDPPDSVKAITTWYSMSDRGDIPEKKVNKDCADVSREITIEYRASPKRQTAPREFPIVQHL